MVQRLMSPGFGPGFQDARSRLYRAEYSAISIMMFAYLVWRTFYPKEIKTFLVAEEGWEPVRASELEDLAKEERGGRSSSWRSDIIAVWRAHQ